MLPETLSFGSIGSQLATLFAYGGPVLYVLAAVSVIALTIVIAKLMQFAVASVGRRGFIKPCLELWDGGARAEVVNVLQRERGPVAAVMFATARSLVHGSLPPDLAREETDRVAQAQLIGLRSGLRGLEMIVQIAPLLGLLGTVIGMIGAFRALQDAGNSVDPAALAGGIWTALITTAAGLSIAIPAAAALYYLEGRVERERETMEIAATGLFTSPGNLRVAATPREAASERASESEQQPEPVQ